MKKMAKVCIGMALLATGSVQAMEAGVDVGKDFTQLHFSLGEETTGPVGTADWLHSNHDGQLATVGVGYNMMAGPIVFTPGVKMMFGWPKNNEAAQSALIGLGTAVPVTNGVSVYGEFYYSRDPFTQHFDTYHELSAGISFRPVSLVDLRLGYKNVAINGHTGWTDHKLADGFYAGSAIHF